MQKLGLDEPKHTNVSLQLADRFITYPKRIVEYVLACSQRWSKGYSMVKIAWFKIVFNQKKAADGVGWWS